MKYLYMDNFRGFSETVIPLRKVNFLVGENSTGKTSVINLISILSDISFFLSRIFDEKQSHFFGFNDIASIGSKKEAFVVGFLDASREGDHYKISFSINTFSDKNGVAELSHSIRASGDNISAIKFEKSSIFYGSEKFINRFESSEDCLAFFKVAKAINFEDFTSLGAEKQSLPWLFFHSLGISRKNPDSCDKGPFDLGQALFSDIKEIAPIRSVAKRIYEALDRSYSPEGEHIPTKIRKTISSPGGVSFSNLINSFGSSSGLFESIKISNFGKKENSPFEILVKISNKEININSVGYGVSQVLPIAVEFLTGKNSTFVVQQPEVHLHPKAQAALGDLIHDVSLTKNNLFVIETHSNYLIDRFRVAVRKGESEPDSQVLFFARDNVRNSVSCIEINKNGSYSCQPDGFLDFFMNEEMSILGI